MMVTTPSASSGQKNLNQLPRICLVRLPITGVYPRMAHHQGAGVGYGELRSLLVSTLIGFKEPPLPLFLLVWVPLRGQ